MSILSPFGPKDSFTKLGVVFFGGGGSSAPQQVTQTTKTDPWPGQEPFLRDVFQQAQQQFRQQGPEFFPGQTFAGFDPLQQQAQQQALQFSQGPGQQFAQNLMGAHQFALGPVLDPQQNLAIQSAAEGAIRPLFQELTETTLPAIRGEAVGAGQFGGSRQGIAEGLAAGRTSQAAGDVTSRIFSDAYQQGLDSFTRGLALAPQTLGAAMMPFQLTEAVGSQRQFMDQQAINEAIARHNAAETLERAKLAEFSNLIQGQFGGQTAADITGMQQFGQTSPIASALGGASAGAGIGATFGGIGGPIGAGIGALVGLFGG